MPVSGVEASAGCSPVFDGDTPTATFHPLMVTSTPLPPDNFHCPEGTSVGGGTVTPGLWWSETCGKCLSTPTPTCAYGVNQEGACKGPHEHEGPPTETDTPGGTVTQMVTFTPTVQPTSTVVSPGPFLYQLITSGTSAQGSIWGGITCVGDLTGTTYMPFYPGAGIYVQNNTLHCYGSFGVNNGLADYTNFSINSSIIGGNGYPVYYKENVTQSCPDGRTWFMNMVGDGSTTDETQRPKGQCIYAYGSGSINFDLQLSRWDNLGATPIPPTATVTATITPQPTIVSTCNQVQPEGSDNEQNALQLPSVMVGVGPCYGIPAISLPLHLLSFLGLNFPDVNLSQVQVCLDPVEIGDMVVAGTTINFNLMIYGLAVAGALAIWFGRK